MVMPHQFKGSDHSGRSIEIGSVTRATIERIWAAWTDPARIIEWFADEVTGSFESGQITWHFKRLASSMTYRVIAMTPGERLLLESVDNPSTRLEIILAPFGESTMVRVIHSGFLDVAESNSDYSATHAGWQIALAILRYYAEFHFGQSRQSFFVMRPAPFNRSRLTSLYHDPLGLQEWIAEGGSLGTEGGRVHLALKNGEMLRGDMLADTEVEVAMAWDEIAGVIQFRSCSLPGSGDTRAVYLHGWGWGLSAERARQIETQLGPAMDRLERALDQTPMKPVSIGA
jgi:uncharacterized protein YndB with AHSA1/START domain